ncbi:hypothetical protein F3J34_13970 [Klebsiella sp. Ap-873]|nr:hypothetical protein [Klebsiella sp. Ap-873]
MKLTKDTNLELLSIYIDNLRNAIAVIEITHRVELDSVSSEMAVSCALNSAYLALEDIDNL